LPPDAVVGGQTIGDWSAEWWKWVFSVPTNQNPLYDIDGSKATNGQPATDVFFVAGIHVISGTVTRAFDVPEGKHLFLSPMNVNAENIDTFPPLTVEQLRDAAAAYINTTVELHVSIDGVPVQNLFGHRAVSPVFSFEFLNPDNTKTFAYGHPIVGLIDPIVSDGYWFMINPLPLGPHVINFGGRTGFGFATDITDFITVVPVPLMQQVTELASLLEASNLPQKRKQALLDELNTAAKDFGRNHLLKGVEDLREFQKKVRREVGRFDQALADQLIAAAQKVIDRAVAQLRDQPKHTEQGQDNDNEDDDIHSGVHRRG
jgi:hypothetical protein